MTKNALYYALGSLLLILTGPLLAADPLTTLLGNAYDLDSNELLYQEHHKFKYEGDKLISAQVEYRRPDGELIAQKNLDFKRSASIPAFKTVHTHGGFVEGLEYRDDGLYLFHQKDGEEMQSKTIKARDNMAADAGFNNYVYQHFEQINNDDTVKFYFVAPNHLTAVKFKAQKTGTREIEGLEVVDFKVAISSFLSLFVDPLLVSYNPETRNLIEYRGLSNIRDDDGELFKVRIRYPQLLANNKSPPEAE